MKDMFIALGAAIVVVAAVTSCGDKGNIATTAATPTPIPSPSVACTAPPGEQIQVVYPQPNATGVTTAQVIIAVAPAPLPTDYKLYLQVQTTQTKASLGNAYGGALTQITSTSLPPNTLVPPFVPTYESSDFGGFFGTGDTFSVYLVNASCYPGVNLNSSFQT